VEYPVGLWFYDFGSGGIRDMSVTMGQRIGHPVMEGVATSVPKGGRRDFPSCRGPSLLEMQMALRFDRD